MHVYAGLRATTEHPIVCKFGGTSVADAAGFRRVREIVEAEPARRFVVPSAPGKRHRHDQKVTDLLYLCRKHVETELPVDEVFEVIRGRFVALAAELGCAGILDGALEETKAALIAGASAAHTASRGEYLNGRLAAAFLGAEFIDAAEVIRFDGQGRFDAEATDRLLRARLPATGRAVIPGFYGARADGTIETFSRGGSDVSGAIVAHAAAAAVYENWTDVPGLLMADPDVVKDPLPINELTYRELRELSYMGARVLHDEAIFPVTQSGIPVNIRCTGQPDHPGTLIVQNAPAEPAAHAITGIAGRKDFTAITLTKALMNKEIGFGVRVLQVLENHGISWEHLPSGIDTLSIVMQSGQVKDKLDAVIADLRVACKPDTIEAYTDMALVATVGRGMMHTPGIAARLFSALAADGVNVRMIDQGSGELNIIVGVRADDFETAVRAIYRGFVSAVPD